MEKEEGRLEDWDIIGQDTVSLSTITADVRVISYE